jgi:hypothetical protein
MENQRFGLLQRVFIDGIEDPDRQGWMVVVAADQFRQEFFDGFYEGLLKKLPEYTTGFHFEADHPDEMKTLVIQFSERYAVHLVPFRTYPDLHGVFPGNSGGLSLDAQLKAIADNLEGQAGLDAA